MKVEDVDVDRARTSDVGIECDSSQQARALGGAVRTRPIHENTPHHLGGDAEELSAIPPRDSALVHEAEIEASCTRSAGCNVCPRRSRRRCADARRRSSAYTSGMSRSRAATSPSLQALRNNVTWWSDGRIACGDAVRGGAVPSREAR